MTYTYNNSLIYITFGRTDSGNSSPMSAYKKLNLKKNENK